MFTRICKITDSSNISEIAYDPGTKLLQVTFTNGAIYQYPNIDPSVIGMLMGAKSVGTNFNGLVRANHGGTKIK